MNLRQAAASYLQIRRQLGEREVLLTRESRAALGKLPGGASAPSAKNQASAPVDDRPRPAVTPAPAPVSYRPAPSPVPQPSPATAAREVFEPLSPDEKIQRLAAFREEVLPCVKCDHLAKSRKNVVFGVGNPNATIMFVGEAPGADEDEQGEPFVGKAGQLLTKMIEAMGVKRPEVYIANVLKCRPDMPPGATGNRKPTPQEMATCLPYLQQQIRIIQPKVMVALGATGTEGLFGLAKAPIMRMRGTWLDFHGIPVMPTYHPSYLLRNQSVMEKRKVWEDLMQVMDKAGLPISEKQRNFFLSKL